jgi:HD-GYP domain-containing protein (c-di-GMP phosphodiesterase class II)
LNQIRPEFTWATVQGILIFSALSLVAEATPVRLPRGEGSVSIGFVFIFASILIFGAGVGAWVAALGTISIKEVKGEISIEKTLFNRAQLAICAGIAGLVYVGLGGVPGSIQLPQGIIPMIASSAVYMLLNISIMVGVMALAQGISPLGMWMVNFRWLTMNYLMLAPLGVLISNVYLNIGLIGVLAFMLPLFLARHSFQRYIDMQDVYLSTVTALATSIDAKDPYTKGHSDRVNQYTLKMARQLKLPEDQLDMLQYMSLLHDIGKIGIKDSVLNKPGKLTEEEFDEIKKHPEVGYRIISEIKYLSKSAEVVRHHHERYNGMGYPSGLIGEKIPLGSRIISVADAYDAMTTERPYKKAMTHEEALLELNRCSGTQFDPRVVKAFIEVFGDPESMAKGKNR